MWDVLGIEPTNDAKAVRRAYAARLRALDPDKDPAAFQALRQAYERALWFAQQKRAVKIVAVEQPARVPTPETISAPPSPPPAQSAPIVIPAPPEEIAKTAPAPVVVTAPVEAAKKTAPASAPNEEVQGVLAALQARDYRAAFEHYDRGLARGTFPLGARENVTERIMQQLVRDRDVTSEAFAEFMAHAGWSVLPSSREHISPTRRAAMDRLQAEQWHTRMRALAEKRDEPVKSPVKRTALQRFVRRAMERRSARLFFGGWAFTPLLDAGREDLRKKIAEYQHYKAWFEGRIDPKVVVRAERIADQNHLAGKTINALFWIATVFAFLALGAILFTAGITPIILVPLIWGFRYGRVAYKRFMSRV